MLPPEKDPLGQALLDYREGEPNNQLTEHCDTTEDDVIPVRHFFRTFRDMPYLEQLALEQCRGRVLDIGAGAGSHALELIDMGLNVTTLDVSPLACRVMKERGLRNVVHSGWDRFEGSGFDTLLMMMNGVGVTGSLDGLDRFLEKAKSMLNPTGQIILDSSDIQYLYREVSGALRIELNKAYYGEVTYQMEYQEIMGAPFGWLYADPAILEKHAKQQGYQCTFIDWGKHFEYLVRLELS